ncbi:MAG TPA: hypothetical protein ENJ35_11435, partial [Gammaproteobacteria bacterium]|nr:hypothetical protein [Gammaproteobacteria bacterium]
MKKRPVIKTLLAFSLVSLLSGSLVYANNPDEVLVTVDDAKITAKELNQALTSSPFYTQFNTMSEDDQASLRGDLLRRLVASQLLRFEAQEQKLDQTPEFKKELEIFRTGLLYRRYMDHLRGKIKIPDVKMQELKGKFKSDPDALEAAKSAFRSSQYRRLHDLTIQSLRDRDHVKIHESLISKDTSPETILLEGDDGLKIAFGDILRKSDDPSKLTRDQVLDRLYQRGELLLVARAAEKEKLDVSKDVAKYRYERLPALLLE